MAIEKKANSNEEYYDYDKPGHFSPAVPLRRDWAFHNWASRNQVCHEQVSHNRVSIAEPFLNEPLTAKSLQTSSPQSSHLKTMFPQPILAGMETERKMTMYRKIEEGEDWRMVKDWWD